MFFRVLSGFKYKTLCGVESAKRSWRGKQVRMGVLSGVRGLEHSEGHRSSGGGGRCPVSSTEPLARPGAKRDVDGSDLE